MKRMAVLLFTFLIPLIAYAETYQGISPLDNLGDLKAKFPAADFSRLYPAWAKETDVLYQITGTGMSGTIVIKFTDYRPIYKKHLNEKPDEESIYKNLANQSDDEAFSVEWVRWIPVTRFPLSRMISKYGKPEEAGFADEDLEPYRIWKRKGLVAFLSDDEKKVARIDFIFTTQDHREAWQEKHGFIPSWLKESKEMSPKKKKK